MRTAVLQYSDFPQSGDWNAVFFSVHAHFLQSDDFVRLLISGSVHDAVGAFADAAELFVHGERLLLLLLLLFFLFHPHFSSVRSSYIPQTTLYLHFSCSFFFVLLISPLPNLDHLFVACALYSCVFERYSLVLFKGVE